MKSRKINNRKKPNKINNKLKTKKQFKNKRSKKSRNKSINKYRRNNKKTTKKNKKSNASNNYVLHKGGNYWGDIYSNKIIQYRNELGTKVITLKPIFGTQYFQNLFNQSKILIDNKIYNNIHLDFKGNPNMILMERFIKKDGKESGTIGREHYNARKSKNQSLEESEVQSAGGIEKARQFYMIKDSISKFEFESHEQILKKIMENGVYSFKAEVININESNEYYYEDCEINQDISYFPTFLDEANEYFKEEGKEGFELKATNFCNLKNLDYNIHEVMTMNGNDIHIFGYPDPEDMGHLLDIELPRGNNYYESIKNFLNYIRQSEDVGSGSEPDSILVTQQVKNEMKELKQIYDKAKYKKIKEEIIEKLKEQEQYVFNRPNVDIHYKFFILEKKGDTLVPLLYNIREFDKNHIDILKKVKELITAIIPKKFNLLLENETEYDNFLIYHQLGYMFGIDAEYIHPTKKTQTYSHFHQGRITIEEIIFSLNLDNDYFKKIILRYPLKQFRLKKEKEREKGYLFGIKDSDNTPNQIQNVPKKIQENKNFFSETRILFCNQLINNNIELYLEKDKEYYYVLLEPNVIIKLGTEISRKNEKNYYDCELKISKLYIDLFRYRINSIYKIDNSNYTEYYKKLYDKWLFPAVKQTYKNELNQILESNLEIEKFKTYYADIPFIILCNGIYKYKNINDNKFLLYNDIEQSQIFKVEIINDNILLVYTNINNKYVIWIYRLPKDFDIKNELTEEVIKNLRLTNSLRTLYDLESKEELESIIEAIKKSKNGDVNILNPKINSLYCNKIISYEMSTFHIQILPYNFYQDSLYKQNINIINSNRLLSVYKVLENLKINKDYYKLILKDDTNNHLFNCGYMINTNIF